jgi:hypothetical protein
MQSGKARVRRSGEVQVICSGKVRVSRSGKIGYADKVEVTLVSCSVGLKKEIDETNPD